MNWYIGQECVYIGRTASGYVKNSVVTITSIKQGCHGILINANNIRLASDYDYQYCSKCNIRICKPGDLLHFNEAVFAPLADISELQEILKEKEKV